MMNTLCTGTLVLSLAWSTHAQWPDRHGPDHNSIVPAAQANGLPTTWSATENIAWKAPLHDEGHSSPVVGEGKVWLTAATKDGTKQYVIGVDAQSGKVLHDRVVFENTDVEDLGGAKGFNNYAAPSPVLGPGAVYVHFGSYGTARLDAKSGATIWERRDFPCRHFRGPGSSPLLVDDMLILTFDGIDHQYTVALNATNGETIWKTKRSTDYGDLDENGQPFKEGDLRKAYCTPGIAVVDGKKQLLSVGAKGMQAYDLKNGKEIWSLRHTSYNAAIRPIWLAKEGLALLNTGGRNGAFYAVRLDASTKGDITDSHVVWTRPRGNPRFAKPIYHDGLVYQITDIGVVMAIDAKTGEEVWKGRAKGDYRSSPVLANNLLYFVNEDGQTAVLKTGRSFQQVALNDVPETGTTACPAVAQGALYIRGKKLLVKIAQH